MQQAEADAAAAQPSSAAAPSQPSDSANTRPLPSDGADDSRSSQPAQQLSAAAAAVHEQAQGQFPSHTSLPETPPLMPPQRPSAPPSASALCRQREPQAVPHDEQEPHQDREQPPPLPPATQPAQRSSSGTARPLQSSHAQPHPLAAADQRAAARASPATRHPTRMLSVTIQHQLSAGQQQARRPSQQSPLGPQLQLPLPQLLTGPVPLLALPLHHSACADIASKLYNSYVRSAGAHSIHTVSAAAPGTRGLERTALRWERTAAEEPALGARCAPHHALC